jgi:hypothetical protein
MDERVTPRAYKAPQVIDYGDLQELTADCYGSTGGDAAYPASAGYGGIIGASNPAAGCHSNP